jgi:urease accessory protein
MLQLQHFGGFLPVSDWLIFQLCDSAFPAGGFAHSGGLEAAWQQGHIRSGEALDDLLRCQLNQAARGLAPLVAAAHREPDEHGHLDAFCDAILNNHVANRASRAQGQAFVLAISRVFHEPSVANWSAGIRGGDAFGHFAPAFGAACRVLDIELEISVRLFLFLTLRSLISAAVRLNMVGPLEGQALQRRATAYAETMVGISLSISPQDVTQTAPLLDLLQGGHDRLYSRLFQS